VVPAKGYDDAIVVASMNGTSRAVPAKVPRGEFSYCKIIENSQAYSCTTGLDKGQNSVGGNATHVNRPVDNCMSIKENCGAQVFNNVNSDIFGTIGYKRL
jgi:hypothetical protein